MIRAQLKSAKFFLTLIVFSIPLISFAFAAFLRFGTHLLPRYTSEADPRAYFGLLLLTTILWASSAEHYALTVPGNHLQPRGKFHNVLLACFIPYATVLSATFFYRESLFSRLFIWLSFSNMLFLALLLPTLFHRLWNRTAYSKGSALNFLIVGADEFAKRVADSLVSSGIPLTGIKGHIRLPGQVSVVHNRASFRIG